MPRAYPPEFRRRAVELARLREQPISRIAAELGIAAGSSPPPLQTTASAATSNAGTASARTSHGRRGSEYRLITARRSLPHGRGKAKCHPDRESGAHRKGW